MTDFSDNIVNQRFNIVFDRLKQDGKVKSKSDIAGKLDTYNHVINSVMKGTRGLTVDQINKLAEHYNVNVNFVFGFSDQLYLDDEEGAMPSISLAEKIYEGRNNIVLVPQKASAGYALAAGNPEYLKEFNRFSVPGMEGQLIAFEISGDSMLPYLTNGDLVICEPLERNEMPRDNGVYVVVTDTVVAKRIRRLKDSGEVSGFELISDNTVYHPYSVDLDEIRQILKVKTRLTSYGLA